MYAVVILWNIEYFTAYFDFKLLDIHSTRAGFLDCVDIFDNKSLCNRARLNKTIFDFVNGELITQFIISQSD